MRKLKLVAVAVGLFVAAIPQQASAGVPECSIQANWRDDGGGVFRFTAAVNCTVGTQMLGCAATAHVVAANALRTDPQQTTQGQNECLNSYSTVLARDNNPGDYGHYIEATFTFELPGGAAQLVEGGDTAPGSLTCVLGTSFFCTARSTTYP